MVHIDNVGVYHHTCNEWLTNKSHFDRLINVGYQFDSSNYYYDEVEFIQSSHTKKFATYHVPFPHSTDWLDKFDKLYDYVDHSFVFCSEMHQVTIDQLRRIDKLNVTIFISGFVNIPFKNAKEHQWMDWLDTTSNFYKNVRPDLLSSKLVAHTNKQKSFDILLGCWRPHRDYVYNYINQHGLSDNVIMTYHKLWNQDLRQSSEYILENEGVEYICPPNHTVHLVKYYGHTMTMSQVAPIEIYNKSCYSLVAETNAHNEFNFYTEKIVKPILAGRLFVVVSGQHYLKNLKKLGFKTFDGIIDESYDNEADDVTRWEMALTQVNQLMKKDPIEVYNNANEVIKHNQKLILEFDWYSDFQKNLLDTIKASLS